MIRANITNSDLDDLVGKSFRMNSFSDEAPEVNERYKDAIGVFTSAGPIFRDRNGRHAMINVKWQKPELNGSILSIDAACDDFVLLGNEFESKYERSGKRLLEAKNLTPEEKMDRWHRGERKENIKACSEEKLKDYRKICRAKGYTEQVKLINAELRRRKNENNSSVNESFTNNELTRAVTEHGGLKNNKYTKLRDARSRNSMFDIQQANYWDYLEPEDLEVLQKVNPYWPIAEQILYTNDGGAIVITRGDADQWSVYSAYKDKLKARGEKYMNRTEPSGEWKLLGVTDSVTRNRRREHLKAEPWE